MQILSAILAPSPPSEDEEEEEEEEDDEEEEEEEEEEVLCSGNPLLPRAYEPLGSPGTLGHRDDPAPLPISVA
jgi:hypothetical protein